MLLLPLYFISMHDVGDQNMGKCASKSQGNVGEFLGA